LPQGIKSKRKEKKRKEKEKDILDKRVNLQEGQMNSGSGKTLPNHEAVPGERPSNRQPMVSGGTDSFTPIQVLCKHNEQDGSTSSSSSAAMSHRGNMLIGHNDLSLVRGGKKKNEGTPYGALVRLC